VPRRAPSPRPATLVSPALAAQLQAQGHALLASGSYASAASVLRRSIAVSGERLADCLQPLTAACLTYAYALYDLGGALRLGGDPQAAVAVLEDRLEIDNQRPAVAAELDLAQTEARKATTSAAH
jgi:tetratricopeptide (TPR) repeat protein